MKIALLAGDGIGPEILREALKVLDVLRGEGLSFETEEALVGGAAYDAHGDPFPQATLQLARQADAVLFGAVGGPRYDTLPREKRPEKAILGLRKECDFFANLRPANVFPELADASSLKAEIVSGLDIMIVRELTGDIYFGQPRGVEGVKPDRMGFNTMRYTEPQIRRILHVGFKTARQRGKRLPPLVGGRFEPLHARDGFACRNGKGLGNGLPYISTTRPNGEEITSLRRQVGGSSKVGGAVAGNHGSCTAGKA